MDLWRAPAWVITAHALLLLCLSLPEVRSVLPMLYLLGFIGLYHDSVRMLFIRQLLQTIV